MKIFGLKFILFFFFLWVFYLPGDFENRASFAAENSSKSKNSSPTRIRSDIIDIKRKSQTIDFIGNVAVEKDDSSLLAKKMTVFYEQKTLENGNNFGSKKSTIKRIDAEENVKIFSEEFVASGERGYYYPQENVFVLEKNVIVNNGTSIANGDKFSYNLTTKKGRFIGKKNETSIKGQNKDERVIVIIGDDLSTQENSGKLRKKSIKNDQNSQR